VNLAVLQAKKQVVQRKNIAENMTVHIWNSGLLGVVITSEQKPQCVVCYEVLSNECMKPAELRRHLETKHSDVKNKPLEFFSCA
jgi:hypothetical protein